MKYNYVSDSYTRLIIELQSGKYKVLVSQGNSLFVITSEASVIEIAPDDQVLYILYMPVPHIAYCRNKGVWHGSKHFFLDVNSNVLAFDPGE